jgi:electron transport complex protein RnfA
MGDFVVLAISCILINNILLAQYLGNCPFLGTSKKMETAVGMAMAVVFVLVLAGIITWIVNTFILTRWDLVYLRTVAFILVIASLVQFVEMFLKKSIPVLYAGLGIFLPLITTNCAVMGVCLINVNEEYNFIQALVASFAYAVGFGLALMGAKTAPGYIDCPGNRRDSLIDIFCLQRDGVVYEGSGCFFHDKMIAPALLISNWLMPPR